MKIQCPHCKAGFKIPEGHSGEKVKCTKCDKIFVIVALPETKVFPSKVIHSSTHEKEIIELVETLEKVLDTITNYDDQDIAEAQKTLRHMIAKYRGTLE